MSKYICLCGATYKTKEMSELHMKMYEELELREGFARHKIFKQHWQARFATWFFNFPWGRSIRLIGAYMIFVVITRHVDFSLWEAVAVGTGLGLYIE